MTYRIRPFRDGDAERMEQICRAAIATVGARAYSSEQLAAWRSGQPDSACYRARVAAGARVFVAADADDLPVAYALLEPDGHLDRLYCHPDHTRRGLAERVIAAVEHAARAAGLDRLWTEASELARPAFERCGFAVTHRRDFELAGVAIHNYAMEKPIGEVPVR